MFKDGRFDAVERPQREDLVVGNGVLPTDSKDSSELSLLEPLQTFDIPTTESSGLERVQKSGEDYRLREHDFEFYGEAVIA